MKVFFVKILKYYCAISLCIVFLAASAFADEKVAAKLLTDGWKKSTQTKNNSESWFKSASVVGDPDLIWSYVLNRLRHYRFSEAANFGDELVRLNPHDLDAWYTRIWLEISQRELNRALVTMQKFEDQLNAIEELDDPKNDDQLLRSYQRLGRLVGFLESAHAGKYVQTTFDETVDKIRIGTKKDFFAEFDDQRANSNKKYLALAAQLANEEKKLVEQAKRERVVKIDSLRVDITNADVEVDDIRKDIDQVRKDGQQRLDNINETIGQIQSEGDRVSADIYSTRRELGSLYGSLAFNDWEIFYEPDPFIRRQLIRRHDQSVFLARDREFALNDLYWGARDLYGQLRSAQWDKRQTSNSFGNRIASLESEKDWLRRTQRAANRKIAKLQKPPKPLGGSVVLLKRKIKSLKQYDPFPLESFRDVVLKRVNR